LRRYEADLDAEAACLEMIRTIAREGRAAIERGDFVLVDSDEAKEDLFRELSGREPPWNSLPGTERG